MVPTADPNIQMVQRADPPKRAQMADPTVPTADPSQPLRPPARSSSPQGGGTFRHPFPRLAKPSDPQDPDSYPDPKTPDSDPAPDPPP
ncbi:hypothetical protein T484DRAFT_1959053 [Baffinella frigidus]|nr:hypothetical protein T484DRAFT_1959053 [Cryptophyta sp. CCMP2293]